MNLQIKLIDTTLPMPEYHTEGAVAFDLYARIETVIEPFKLTIVPTNLIIKSPHGYFILLASRSSTPIKKGLMLANGIGIVDEDYCGEKDEIGLQLLNFTQEPVTVSRGERIGQAMLVKTVRPEKIEQVSSMSAKSRGGFGSTG